MHKIATITLLTLMFGCENQGSSSNQNDETDTGKVISTVATGGGQGNKQSGPGDSTNEKDDTESDYLKGAHASELFIIGKDMSEPDCDKKLAGKTIYLAAKAQFQFCDGTSWAALDLRGPSGKDGVDGLQGPKGDTGLQGPKGDTGLQGPKGDTGESGAQGASCITTNISGGATITCGNTVSTLASPGAVVVVPQGVVGVPPTAVLNSGRVVYRDANNVTLCELDNDNKCSINNAKFLQPKNDFGLQKIIFKPTQSIIYYQSTDCTGTPIGNIAVASGKHPTYYDGSRYLIGSYNTFQTNILVQSYRSISTAFPLSLEATCVSSTETIISSAFILIDFTLPSELADAAFPVSLYQMP